MRIVLPGTRIEHQRWVVHLVIPALLSLAMMGLYFSGSAPLRGIVAPTIDGLHPFSWREFGALEMLQNLVLLMTVAVIADCARRAHARLLRASLVGCAAVFVFVLLEEIDYGRHVAEYISGDVGSLAAEGWDRNIHNRLAPDGVQYGSYMRLAATVVVGLGFVLAPLWLHATRHPWVQLLLPSRWMVVTVALMVGLSWLAHALDDAGLASIGGVPGNLEHNISEFRELNLYYLFALYFIELRARLEAGWQAPTAVRGMTSSGESTHDLQVRAAALAAGNPSDQPHGR